MKEVAFEALGPEAFREFGFYADMLPGDGFPAAKTRVFRVPQGTMVVIKPGTRHHAPFCLKDRPVNVLVALPERTYVNDCHSILLEGDQGISIKVPPAQP